MALFTSSTAELPVAVELGKGTPVTLTSPASPGSVTVYEWIMGFYLNVLRGRWEAVEELCETTSDALRNSPTKNPEYRYLYMDAIQSFCRAKDDVTSKVIAAVEATDPKRPDVRDEDWTLFLDVHQLKVFIYMAARRQGEFTEALVKALESHKDYWSAKKGKRYLDYRGFISLELTGLALPTALTLPMRWSIVQNV